MPTYEYRCSNCKNDLEIFQSIKAKPIRKCPKCGKNTLQRLISTGGAVLFKGSGFWQTEYRSEGYKKDAAADKPSEAKTETKSDSKPAETKPDAKPTAKAEVKSESKPAPKSEPKPAKKEKK
jgi:putative FmdB family regulatory protein